MRIPIELIDKAVDELCEHAGFKRDELLLVISDGKTYVIHQDDNTKPVLKTP